MCINNLLIETMKNIFLILGLTLSLFLTANTQPTTLTYFTEHQVDQQSDYIEIGITVHCEDSVLKNGVRTANGIVEKLEKIVMNYCLSQSKKKSQCDEVFEASKHKIQPKYQLVRKVETFIAFVVSHEITIKIEKFEGLGKMTDQLLAAGNGLITIDSFDWKSENQQNPERQALKAGLQDGEEICKRMGLKLLRIISAQEVQEKEEGDAGGDQEEEEDAEEEQDKEESAEVIVFKFEVQCN